MEGEWRGVEVECLLFVRRQDNGQRWVRRRRGVGQQPQEEEGEGEEGGEQRLIEYQYAGIKGTALDESEDIWTDSTIFKTD